MFYYYFQTLSVEELDGWKILFRAQMHLLNRGESSRYLDDEGRETAISLLLDARLRVGELD